MESLIKPEPSEDERRAILAALETGLSRPTAYESRWREAALEEGVSDGAPGEHEPGALVD
jgi:hypothetical protein